MYLLKLMSLTLALFAADLQPADSICCDTIFIQDVGGARTKSGHQVCNDCSWAGITGHTSRCCPSGYWTTNCNVFCCNCDTGCISGSGDCPGRKVGTNYLFGRKNPYDPGPWKKKRSVGPQSPACPNVTTGLEVRVADVLKRIDANGDKCCDMEEVVWYYVMGDNDDDTLDEREGLMRQEFTKADTDGNGCLDVDEIEDNEIGDDKK